MDPEPLDESIINRTQFLVIDEIPANLKLIERYLMMSAAAKVRTAQSPLLALRILQDPRTPADCVMCAQNMSPMSGLEFLQNLRTGRYGSHALNDIKFILMMKEKDDAIIQVANSYRVNGVIFGALDRTTMTQSVVNALTPSPAQTATGTPGQSQAQDPASPASAPPPEHVYGIWYCTEESPEKIGSISYVLDPATPLTPFVVSVKQGVALFPTWEKAEAWLQKRVRGGSKLKRC